MIKRLLFASAFGASLLAGQSVCAQTFLDLSEAAGVENLGMYSSNLAWADFDGDGDLDLYVTNWAAAKKTPPNVLYVNNGDSTFTDLAASLGVADVNNSAAAAWGDYDNDGDVDLYVTNFWEQDFIFENLGDSFTTRQVITPHPNGSETSVAWGDYDNDGYLDIYIGKYYYDNQLYHNEGDGTLVPVTDLGVGDRRDTHTFTWVDYDNDGDLDLYTVNREQENALYRNDLTDRSSFTEVACALSLANAEIGQHAAWGDYDNDGDLDLFLANIGANNLYRSDGDGLFTDVALAAGLRQSSIVGFITTMAAWADYNGDGWLDLYLATGGDEFDLPDYLFANRGDGTFRDATSEAGNAEGMTSAAAHLSAGWGDFDGDGAPDLYATHGRGDTEIVGNRLYLNATPDDQFIKVVVRGKGPEAGGANLFAIGAQVLLRDATTDELVAYRQVQPGLSHPEGNPLTSQGGSAVVFGAPAGAYNVEVIFPGNDVKPRFFVEAGQPITIDEP